MLPAQPLSRPSSSLPSCLAPLSPLPTPLSSPDVNVWPSPPVCFGEGAHLGSGYQILQQWALCLPGGLSGPMPALYTKPSFGPTCQPREKGGGAWPAPTLHIPAKPSLTWAPRGLAGISRCQPRHLALCHTPDKWALVGWWQEERGGGSGLLLPPPSQAGPGVSSSECCFPAQSPLRALDPRAPPAFLLSGPVPFWKFWGLI